VTITRFQEGSDADAFLALSTTCPHLGCRVHWEPHNSRFFCPCHNGVFDAQGKATQGPPADANQSLPQFPVKVENGLVFIEAPTEVLG
jgi:Rieske Fe-S protein